MVDIEDSPDIAKNNIEPLRAAGWYALLSLSISALVTLAFSIARVISTLLRFVSSKVATSSMFSNMSPLALVSSLSKLSSSSFLLDWFSLISVTRRCLASSLSGFSYLTTSFSSWSSSPLIVTV